MKVWVSINERGEWLFENYKEGVEPTGGSSNWLSTADIDKDLIFFYKKVEKLYREATQKIDKALGLK